MAHKQNHKTFSATDVLDSINEMDFKTFTGPMKSALDSYQKSIKDKKDIKRKSVGSANIPAASTASPTKIVNHNVMQRTQPLTMSSDIIEIDDSD